MSIRKVNGWWRAWGGGCLYLSCDGRPATSVGIRPRALALDEAGNLFIADTSTGRKRCAGWTPPPRSSPPSPGKEPTTTPVTGGRPPPRGVPFHRRHRRRPGREPVHRRQQRLSGPPGRRHHHHHHHHRRREPGVPGVELREGLRSGDGGPATQASLAYPVDLAVDDCGNVFIADWGNCRVRRVDAATATIDTVIGSGPAGPEPSSCRDFAGDGGPATSARLSGIDAVSFDPAGDLYVAHENSGTAGCAR